MKNSRENQLAAFGRLLDIMDDLREKCPWDKKQTFESLRHLTIEETYELGDAILNNDLSEIKKELGDLALHLVFYAKLGDEVNAFDIADVLNSICEKLIYRHPHIYGDEKVENEEDVKKNWEKLKLKEKGGNSGVLAGVPKSLPAMVKASRIQDKARGVGFDWEEKDDVWLKIKEEIAEFEDEFKGDVSETQSIKMEQEFGDMLFSLINFARLAKINPEDALEKTNLKFIRRFNYLEEQVKLSGKEIDQLSLKELDVFWDEAKSKGL